jgi:hypothetical protein
VRALFFDWRLLRLGFAYCFVLTFSEAEPIAVA